MQQVVSKDIVETAIINPLENQICTDYHPGISCNEKAFNQFVITSKSLSKMYLMVHLIPLLLFKRKQLKQNPAKEIKKVTIAFIKSLLFAGGYTFLVRRIVCLVTQIHKFAGYSNMMGGIFASFTLIFEPVSRQSQIALYCLNKSMEVCYLMAKRRKWPVRIAGGEILLFAIAAAIVCYHYINNPEAIRGSYLSIIDKLLKNI